MTTKMAGEHRSRYLTGGRRVRVSDLLNAELIRAGERLRFTRNRIGVTFDATVTGNGRIRLEPDGKEFTSPSRAAIAAAGMRAVDGWRAWRVIDQDRFLDAVRQDFLDQEFVKVTAATEQQRIHERLRQARRRADEDVPDRVSVRELLALWGATDRGDQVSQIEADLANHGLVTSPSFRAVTLDTVVSLTTPQDEEEETASVRSSEMDDLPDTEDDEDGRLDVRMTVGNLTPLLGVRTVEYNGTIREAITTMLLNDISQLAVPHGSRKLHGVVTWRSIAQAVHEKPDASVADAIDPNAEVFRYDRDLFDVLPTLQRHEFVFVSDDTGAIKGIVTTADVAARYGDMATPFFQVGELDQTLRWVLSRAVDPGTVKQLCNKTIASFDELAFGDYQRLLENKEVWEKLAWPLDRRTFIARLDEIRHIRNKVMHFHPDPVSEDAVNDLRTFTLLVHKYGDPG